MLRGFYIEVKVDGRRGTVKVYKQHYTGTDTRKTLTEAYLDYTHTVILVTDGEVVRGR